MKTRKWKREEVIRHLRRDIWRYLTQASKRYDPNLSDGERLLLSAGAVLQMPAAEVRHLAYLDFILSGPVQELLEQMPSLIRRLTTTTIAETETNYERIRGNIRWGETFARRAAMGTPHLFVTAPTRRAFDTPDNQVLAFALSTIARVGKGTGWSDEHAKGQAKEVHHRVSEANRWFQARQFTGLGIQPPTPRTLSRVRSGRARLRYQSALCVVDTYLRHVAPLDRQAIRRAVEERALIVSSDDTLLEIYCAFDVINALLETGWEWESPNIGLLRRPVIFRGHRDGVALELYYQSVPRELSVGSIYRDIQVAHGFPNKGSLRPDLVIKTVTDGSVRWLLIEVKGGPKRGVADSAREAALDLLGYRRAFAPILDQQAEAYGVGYAWGSGLRPSTESEVMLCTPDTLPDALNAVIS